MNQSLRLFLKELITWVQFDNKWFLCMIVDSLDVYNTINLAKLALINELVNFISAFYNRSLQAVEHDIHLPIVIHVTLRYGHRDLTFTCLFEVFHLFPSFN